MARALTARRAPLRAGLARLAAASLAGLVLAACGGPELIVTTDRPARIYLRVTHAANGEELPGAKSGPLLELGEAPAEWEVPEEHYGGAVYLKAVFENGEREAYHVQLPRSEDDDDQVKRILHPKGLK